MDVLPGYIKLYHNVVAESSKLIYQVHSLFISKDYLREHIKIPGDYITHLTVENEIDNYIFIFILSIMQIIIIL